MSAFVIHSCVLLYMARLYSRTHRLALLLLYLICSYFTVFFLSSNIKYNTSCVLRSSRSLTRLSSCKGCTTASKALLRLQRFCVKLNSLASDPKPVLVTTMTTLDSCRPKMHTKPIQAHVSGCEQVQSPQQDPSKQASNASTLTTCLIFAKSIFRLVLIVFR